MSQGIVAAACRLLAECDQNLASEEDLRMLEQCEERLKLAGFGNFTENGRPFQVLDNLIKELGNKMRSAKDREARTRLYHEYGKHLMTAGFSEYYHADYIAYMEKYSFEIVGHITHEKSPSATRENPVEDSMVLEARRQASMIRVGYLTAANLLSELEMGLASDEDLRLFSEYEERLKLQYNIQETDGFPPPTPGEFVSKFLHDIATGIIHITNCETKVTILDYFDAELQLAGFGEHYSAVQIETLREQLEYDLIASEKAASVQTAEDSGVLIEAVTEPEESRRAIASSVVPDEAKPSRDKPDQATSADSSKRTVEKASQAADECE